MRPVRRRPAWRDEGDEPDYRYSLANERTFLAWVRTALALMAGAVGVVHFAPGEHLSALRTALAILLAALGIVVAAAVYAQWRAVERAARLRQPFPHSPLLPAMAVVLTVSGVCVLILVIAG